MPWYNATLVPAVPIHDQPVPAQAAVRSNRKFIRDGRCRNESQDDLICSCCRSVCLARASLFNVNPSSGALQRFASTCRHRGIRRPEHPHCSRPRHRGIDAPDTIDATGLGHGFIREPNGKFVSFDVQAAATGPGQGTCPFAINLEKLPASTSMKTTPCTVPFVPHRRVSPIRRSSVRKGGPSRHSSFHEQPEGSGCGLVPWTGTTSNHGFVLTAPTPGATFLP